MTSDHRSTRLRSGPGLSVSATQIDVRRCFFAFQVHFGSDGADAYVLVTYYVQVRRPFHPFLAREIAGRRSGALSARVSLSLRDRARDRGDARAGTTYRVYSTVRGHYPLNKGLNKKQKHNNEKKSCVTRMPMRPGCRCSVCRAETREVLLSDTCRAPFLRMQKPSGMDHAGPTVVIIGRHAKYSWRTASMGLRHMGQLWPMCCRLAAHSRQQHT